MWQYSSHTCVAADALHSMTARDEYGICFFQAVPWWQVLPQLVTTQKQLARAISLSKQTDRVAIDCEGCQLSHEGRLCLVQVCLHASAIMAYYMMGFMLMTPHMFHAASASTAWSICRSNKKTSLLFVESVNCRKILNTLFRSSNFMHSNHAGENKLSCSKTV